MKLDSVQPSTNENKKYMAVFIQDSGRTKTTHFGAKGMDDFTITHDKNQRKRYRERHAKDLTTNDPTRAGYLSYYLLWGDSTNLQKNIETYKRKFNL